MRQKVNTFFHVFRGSLLPQAKYYSKIPKASFSFSLKYFVSLILILNLVLIIFAVIKYNPNKINNYLDGLIKGLQTFPDELVVNIRNGRLFTSYNRPYFFWTDLKGKKILLLVIDETAAPTKIHEYRSYVLLTSKELVLKINRTSDDQLRIFPLSYFGNQNFNNKTHQKVLRSLTTIKNLLLLSYLIIVPGLIVLLPLSSFLITLFYLLIISLLIYIIFKIYFHKKIYYKKTLQIAFHAVTFPLLLDYFFIIIKPSIQTNWQMKPFFPSPLIFMVLLGVFVFAAVYEAYHNHQSIQRSHFQEPSHKQSHKHTNRH